MPIISVIAISQTGERSVSKEVYGGGINKGSIGSCNRHGAQPVLNPDAIDQKLYPYENGSGNTDAVVSSTNEEHNPYSKLVMVGWNLP